MEIVIMSVDTALISGVIDFRMSPKTYTGSVVAPAPCTKLVMTTSSSDSVRARRAPPRTPGSISGNVTLLNVFHLPAYRSEAASSIAGSMCASRARTMIATNEMLKAMCAKVMDMIPNGTRPVCVNHMRSITAIATSGMMIGR